MTIQKKNKTFSSKSKSIAHSTTNKKKKKKKRTISRKKRENKFTSLFKEVPTWLLWSGGITCAVLYVFIFYFFFVSPLAPRWHSLFGKIETPEGFSIHGIDISRYQGDIDWDRLKFAIINNNALSFVIIKATQGVTIVDPKYKENFENAHRIGFIKGAYHFFSSTTSPKEQAQNFIEQVKLINGDLPPILDIEEKGKLTKEEIKKNVLIWLKLIERHYKVKPIIYANYSYKKKYLNAPIFNQYPYWIAHYYVKRTTYKGSWAFWQYSDRGKLKGINEYVDLNVFKGTMQDLLKLTIRTSTDSTSIIQ